MYHTELKILISKTFNHDVQFSAVAFSMRKEATLPCLTADLLMSNLAGFVTKVGLAIMVYLASKEIVSGKKKKNCFSLTYSVSMDVKLNLKIGFSPRLS